MIILFPFLKRVVRSMILEMNDVDVFHVLKYVLNFSHFFLIFFI